MSDARSDRRRGSQPVDQDSEWLPDHCPKWCSREHAEAVVEMGDWEAAREHMAGGPGGALDEMRNVVDKRVVRPAGGGWNLTIRQRPLYGGGYLDEATVRLEVSNRGHDKRVDLPLTSGEARVLARQLVAMADRIDL